MLAILEEARKELKRRPLLAIDLSIQAFSHRRGGEPLDIHPDQILKVFVEGVRLVVLGTEQSPLRYHSIRTLFDRALSGKQKRFIAICLLRLLCVNNEYFRKNTELHVRTFELFDSQLSEDIYQALRINPRDQTYEKEGQLRDAVPGIESELDATITSFTNLETLSSLRQRFMKKIRSNLAKAIVWPFLPRQLVDLRLDEIFKVVEKYAESNEADMLRNLQETKEVLEAYVHDAEVHGTTYSIQFLRGLAQSLLTASEEHFNGSPASKHADLTIEKSEKKYPFGLPGADVVLQFTLHNKGPGHALDIRLDFTVSENLEIARPKQYLEYLEPTWVDLAIPGRVVSRAESAIVLVEVSWGHLDKSRASESFDFELQGQRSDVAWEQLAKKEPYSLEPVSTQSELVDRREVLEQLLAQAQAKRLGSSYIYGQRRVGKTSIVKTLETELMSQQPQDYLVIYIEMGRCICPDPAGTVDRLGRQICRAIKTADDRLRGLQLPDFGGALSPLSDFLDEVLQIAPRYRILFILDEFDELPLDLYKRGPMGDAFFLTIRSLSGEPSFGFILVGGEKMQSIISSQGYKLNRFQAIPLDHFGRDKHWLDFQELVRMPVRRWMEVSDDALVALYEKVAGNPYFTKLLCGNLFKMMVKRRDSHVTCAEIERAKDLSLQTIESNSFQHFWEDGIVESATRREEISIRRRQVLLCIAETCRRKGVLRKQDVLQGQLAKSLQPVLSDTDIREFERRRVLTEKNGIFEFTVPLFGEWLIKKGVREIITTFSDLDANMKQKKEEEETYVDSKEIVDLIDNWGPYKGRRITEDIVRMWLAQFGTNTNQRLMFRILQNLTFYTEDQIRSKMKEAHGIVTRGAVRLLETGKRKRGELLVGYLGAVGKSGAQYARLYADENRVYVDNVVERGSLRRALESRKNLRALIFVDDFMGTGDSASKYLKRVADECAHILRRRRGLSTFFIAVCGFAAAKKRVEDELRSCGVDVRVHLCDTLDESARCFSESSSVFPDPDERKEAMNVAHQHGVQLVKRDPLGYEDCQATVVFAHSCPNNTLPILWKQSKNPPWRALFKRI